MKMTPDELKELMALHERARGTPVIALSVADGLAGRDFASPAGKRFTDKWVEICRKYELNPDWTGLNSKTGEFVKR